MDRERVLEVLRHVYDPDHPDKSLVELGVVDEQGVDVADDTVKITYCMRAPLCPYSAAIGLLIKRALEEKLSSSVKVQIDAAHYQASQVNEILSDDAKSRDLSGKMEASGLFQKCIRWEKQERSR